MRFLLNYALLISAAITVVLAYVFWLRPILKRTPAIGELLMREESVFAALRAKFAGIKQRVTTVIVTVACFFVGAWDELSPLLAQSGVDVHQLAARIPADWWPWITLSVTLLLLKFRSIADKRRAQTP